MNIKQACGRRDRFVDYVSTEKLKKNIFFDRDKLVCRVEYFRKMLPHPTQFAQRRHRMYWSTGFGVYIEAGRTCLQFTGKRLASRVGPKDTVGHRLMVLVYRDQPVHGAAEPDPQQLALAKPFTGRLHGRRNRFYNRRKQHDWRLFEVSKLWSLHRITNVVSCNHRSFHAKTDRLRAGGTNIYSYYIIHLHYYSAIIGNLCCLHKY